MVKFYRKRNCTSSPRSHDIYLLITRSLYFAFKYACNSRNLKTFPVEFYIESRILYGCGGKSFIYSRQDQEFAEVYFVNIPKWIICLDTDWISVRISVKTAKELESVQLCNVYFFQTEENLW